MIEHYRWINYPKDISDDLKAKYETLADQIEANAKQPICLVWAYDGEDWDDEQTRPLRDCLLVTERVEINNGDGSKDTTFGRNISSHKIY